MNWKSPSTWIAFFSLVAVAFVAVVDMERKSPGPLTSVHGRVEDLSGASNCSSCHGGWFETMTDACLECHERIEAQIDAGEGLHGRIDGALAQRCAHCHSEHHGTSFAIVNRASFARAGVPDPKDFDHRLVGWLMDGRHLELDCAQCHANADVPILPEGEMRFGGLDSNCASCHEDVHEGQLSAVSCASCHGQQSWEQLHSAGHEEHLALVGGHGDVDCRTCHAEGTKHSLEAMGGATKQGSARTCMECHASPHTHEFSAGAAGLLGFDEQRGCVACHTSDHTTFREPTLAVTAEQHALTGYPLVAPHDEAACADCHDPVFPEFAARYPGRGAEQCSACHEDVHGGQFATGPFAGSECTACHDRLAFTPHAFTTELHARTTLPLEGRHLETKCEACHERPSESAPRIFHGTASDCSDCHTDAHAGFFDSRTATLPEVENGDCARCHDATAFDHVPEERFDHGRWTGFSIDGAHSQAECAVCHIPRAQPDAAHRTFGRIEEHFGAHRGCVTCHTDVHEGRFDQSSLPREIAGRTDCARCHLTTSFRALVTEFDHGRWTNFPLLGDHATTSCSGCHTPYSRPDALGRTWGPARGTDCSDCHIDVHEGQFAVDNHTDCARCHTSTTATFSHFDHDHDSRFPLGPQHESLDCSKCHEPYTLPSGDEVIRYKPLPTQCADCHGVSEDVLLRRTRPRNR